MLKVENIKKELSELLTKEIQEIFSKNNDRQLQANLKSDESIVTEIDLLVSNFFKNKLSSHSKYSKFHFYSEEDFNQFHFPCAVLDPIDGTRELAKGRAECAVSLALMNSAEIADNKNYALVYNPFSGFLMDSEMKFVEAFNHSIQNLSGMVSRSEYHKGFFNNIKNQKIHLFPRGSIAFKLALLSSSACDFIVSKNPKNVWDIAAGTILAHQRGYHFFENGKKVTHLDKERYNGVLLWCKDEHRDELMSEFQI